MNEKDTYLLLGLKSAVFSLVAHINMLSERDLVLGNFFRDLRTVDKRHQQLSVAVKKNQVSILGKSDGPNRHCQVKNGRCGRRGGGRVKKGKR